MNKKKFVLLLASTILTTIIIAACSNVSSPTITFSSGDCSYSGPKTIQKDTTLEWVIDDDSQDYYALMIMTFEEGKSLDDFLSWDSADPPSWVTLLYWEIADFGNQTKTKQLDLGPNAAYQGEPLYFGCFIGDDITRGVGPKKVK